MTSANEKKTEKIFKDLYDGYEKGNNWDDALKKVNAIIKKIEEDAERKLKMERRVLVQEIDVLKKSLRESKKEVENFKRIKVPNLQREILKLNQKIKEDGSN